METIKSYSTYKEAIKKSRNMKGNAVVVPHTTWQGTQSYLVKIDGKFVTKKDAYNKDIYR